MFGGRITKFKNPNGGLVVNQTPEPTFNVTTVLNSSTVQFLINTSLTQEQTLFYTLLGNVTNQNFSSGGGTTGSFAVNSSGSATLSFGCNVSHDLGNTNTFQFQLRTGGIDGTVVDVGDNVTIQSQTNIIASGGNVSTIPGFKLHTFDTPGNTTFTLSSFGNYGWALTDYFRTLVVAGGGGGGNNSIYVSPSGVTSSLYYVGGGGGGGGFYQANVVITDAGLGTYNVTVGAGGLTSNVFNNTPAFGGNSSFGSNVVTGGGPGGSAYPGGGGNSRGGASRVGGVDRGGGGGAGSSGYDTVNVTITGGAGTNVGGTGFTTSRGSFGAYAGGGGGGANTRGANATITAVGVSPVVIVPGNGGNGNISTITGNSVYYSGGGASNGRWFSNATAITATGGLGGGGNSFVAGVNGLGGGGGANAVGGSGIVIVSYPDVGAFRFFT
jgi:hypothetical protein